MEQGTTPPAVAMLTQAGVLPNPPNDALILDNACGAGCVTNALFKELGKDQIESAGIKIVCGDLQPNMVETVSERIKANGWGSVVVEAKVVDAQVGLLTMFIPGLQSLTKRLPLDSKTLCPTITFLMSS